MHLTLLKYPNTKTSLYKLSKNHWVIALFKKFGSVRKKLQSTVSLDHPVAVLAILAIQLFAIQLCSIASTELCELVLVGTGEPLAILRQNPNKIIILYGCGFGVKKIGLGQKKNVVRTKSQLCPKISFEGSPYE